MCACSALITTAQVTQMSQTPLWDTREYCGNMSSVQHEDGSTSFILEQRGESYDDPRTVVIFNEDFTVRNTINLGDHQGILLSGLFGQDGKYAIAVEASEKLFNDDNLLEFLVGTTYGWVILNEEGNEVFKKVDPRLNEKNAINSLTVNLLKTRKGNLLQISFEEEKGSEWSDVIDGQGHLTEVYALPGYQTSTGLKVTTIQQLNNPYPNPAQTYINLPYSLPQGVQKATIRIFDVQGKLVQTVFIDNNSEYARIETANLQAGNYFYTVESNGQQGERKQFVVSK